MAISYTKLIPKIQLRNAYTCSFFQVVAIYCLLDIHWAWDENKQRL